MTRSNGRVLAMIGLLGATLVVLPATAGPPKPTASTQKKTENTLDKMAKDLVFDGKAFIQSYQIETGGYCTIQINGSQWNSFSKAQQQQIGDLLAASRAWSELNIVNARLYVYKTEVGRVKPDPVNGGKKFVLY